MEDVKIVTEELDSQYLYLKQEYPRFLADFTLDMLKKHGHIDYLLIGSGLDDAFEERLHIQNYVTENSYPIKSLNNEIDVLKKARDIFSIYKLLEKKGVPTPKTYRFKQNLIGKEIQYPFIIKKKKSSGGISVVKCENTQKFELFLKIQQEKDIDLSEYLMQEFIKGIAISCTVISNGENNQIISVNRQILGEDLLNAPKKYIYCGNTVPANLLRNDRKKVIQISKFLTSQLKLEGIIGFDYVLSNHEPYLMEINPRIPGSIRVSEEALNENLLDLHVKSFGTENDWDFIQQKLQNEAQKFVTKLILFAPQKIEPRMVKLINKHPKVHDKSVPNKAILKGEPVCTILLAGKTFAGSYFNALKIAAHLNQLIEESNKESSTVDY